MPDKTTRLAASLPDSYAARSADGLLYRVLDAVGARLTEADAAVKQLLSAHWLDHATGAALDGLAATFGQRRRTVNGAAETDDALRIRLRGLVAHFTGGGSVAAVKGAVRSALGLPADLADLPVPRDHPLVAAVDALVDLTEFSPQPAVLRQSTSTVVVDNGRSRLDLLVDLPSALPDRPVVELTVTSGLARTISVELAGTGLGVRAQPQLTVRAGETLVLETVLGGFAARVVGPAGQRAVGYLFSSLTGGPAEIPLVPVGASTWVFRAGSGFTGPPAPRPGPPIGSLPPAGPPVLPGPGRPTVPVPRPSSPSQWSAFDEDTFDLPRFDVKVSWTVYTPLTFDVTVPYFLADAVDGLRRRYGFAGPVFSHAGLPREAIRGVIDATRAAGVRGRLRFSIGLPLEGAERQDADESLRLSGVVRLLESADVTESLLVGAVSSIAVKHDQEETLRFTGVFEIATFDDQWTFDG